MPDFNPLWENGPLFAQAEHFRLGTDSVLLADFARLTGAKKGIDLGCASGILSLLLLSKSEKLNMTGLEIVPEAAELARENMEKNGLSERSRILTGDIRECRKLFKTGSFDLIVANPPYYKAGSGKTAASAERAAARGELNCTLEDICAASSYLCRTGGNVFMVNKPERLAEMMCLMSGNGLEPKRLRFVKNTASAAPSLILLEAKRGGNPGLKVEPDLVLKNESGEESEEYRRIYHR